MKYAKNREQRTKRRIPFQVLVECQESKGGKRRLEMLAQNISPSGARLTSQPWAGVNRCPKMGATLVLNGLVYGDKGSVPVKGRVTWTKTKKDNASYEVGLSFVKGSPLLKELDKWQEPDWSAN